MAEIALRANQLAKFRRRDGLLTDQAFAKAIGVHHAQVSRVLGSKAKPGNRFIAGVLTAFGPEWFTDLFDVVPDKNGSGEPS